MSDSSFWFLAISYWIHLLATISWALGLGLWAILSLPALRDAPTGTAVQPNRWLTLQRRILPLVNGSLVLLLVTGFFQMTNDSNYTGFMVLDSLWAWSMLLKHVAYAAVVLTSAYAQWGVQPEINRLSDILKAKPKLAQADLASIRHRERQLVWINVICAVIIFFFTAMMTAIV